MNQPSPDPVASAGDHAAQATFCATLVDEWIRAGIEHAVICPGSRSTPLAVAIASRSEISLSIHHDERAGGFVALGIGKATGKPAVIVTTSGTAAVELHPSVVEAHHSMVPMLVATADRPPELHHVGAAQTIDQQHLFGRAVRWFADPGVPDVAAASSWRSVGARSVLEATAGVAGPGPVHRNLAFREPLLVEPVELPPGRPESMPWHTSNGGDRSGGAVPETVRALLDRTRGVVVAGVGAGDPAEVLALADALGWPVLADPGSGCRLAHPNVVAAADALLRHGDTADSLRPEVVLRLGAPSASKVLGTWLATSGASQILVGEGSWLDPDRSAAHVITASLPSLRAGRTSAQVAAEVDAGWLERWRMAEAVAQDTISAVLEAHHEPTEPGTARALVECIPAGSSLVVSSSMPVRDIEWFSRPRAGLSVFANRGANGIDGVVSTAVGVAVASSGTGRATVALVGDVAFLHDSNWLLGVAARQIDLTVVVIDNDGGGIFSFLPQASELEPARFEALFGTPHGVDLSVLVAAHGLMTIDPSGAEDVRTAVSAGVAAGGVRVVRIKTDRGANVEVHREIEEAVGAALEDAAEHRGR